MDQILLDGIVICLPEMKALYSCVAQMKDWNEHLRKIVVTQEAQRLQSVDHWERTI